MAVPVERQIYGCHNTPAPSNFRKDEDIVCAIRNNGIT
jgi:hypothetical protein